MSLVDEAEYNKVPYPNCIMGLTARGTRGPHLLIKTAYHVQFWGFLIREGPPPVVQWSQFLAIDPEVRVRFPVLTDFLRSSASGTGSIQPREFNLKEKVAGPV
jgi:hypothetical protein